MADISCDVLVIGAGPGGYVCALRASQLGLDTVIVDPNPLGGTCLNVGCIPSKAYIHAADEFYTLSQLASKTSTATALGLSASDASIDLALTQQWKNDIVKKLNTGVGSLLRKAGVKHIKGYARFRDGKNVMVRSDENEQLIAAQHIVIATGSEPVELPTLPFGDDIWSSTEALACTEVPSTLAVVGGGYIGLEIGIAFAKLGSKVTVIESTNSVLPQYDSALTRPVLENMTSMGIKVLTNTRAVSYEATSKKLKIETDSNTLDTIDAQKVLATVGRRPRLEGYALSELSLSQENGFIHIDNRCQTSMRGVYAIGDVTGEPMLAHRAMAQAELVAANIGGSTTIWDKQCIPSVCFTDPEIVSVGLSEQEAQEQDLDVTVAQYPFAANGRAMSIGRTDGFVRVIVREDNHALVGVQAVGAGVSELSAAFSLAIEMGSRAEDIASTIHAHPTISEGFQEACLKVLDRDLH